MRATAIRRHASRRGFTLIETALATIIVGVGVLAIVSAQQAFHKQNSWSTNASTATYLGNEIREMVFNLPREDPVTGSSYWGPEVNESWVGDFDDIDDFDGDDGEGLIFESPWEGTANGPLNARREIISNMQGWAQTVRVFSVDPFEITDVLDDGASDFLLVEVIVTYQEDASADPIEMTRVVWISPN